MLVGESITIRRAAQRRCNVTRLRSFSRIKTEEGARVDTGEFSVNWRQARGRLSSDNLVRPTAWVLYLVQAAVQWKCERLEIVQSRYLTRFAFVFAGEGMPTVGELEDALGSLKVNAVSPLEKLALVTEHQRGLPESQFQVKFRRSDDSVKSLDFGQLVWFDRFRSQAPNTIVFDIDHWKKPEGKDVLSLFSARREQLAIRSELDRFCGPCPIPITLDSAPFHGLRGLKAVRSEFCDKFVAGSVEEMEYDSDRFKMPDPKKGPAMFVGLFAPMMAVGSLIAIFGIPMLSPLTIGVGAGLARTGFWANKNQPFKVPDKVFIRECQDWIEKDVRHLRSLAERS